MKRDLWKTILEFIFSTDNRILVFSLMFGTILILIVAGVSVFGLYRLKDVVEESRAQEVVSDSDSPGSVDDQFISFIQTREYGSAYRLLSSAYRQSVSLDSFTKSVRDNPYLKTSERIGCFRVVTYKKTVHLRKCIMEAGVGKVYAELHYVLESGEWKIAGIVLGGMPAFPAYGGGNLHKGKKLSGY